MSVGIMRELAEQMLAVTYEDIPATERHQVERLLLDSMGCINGAADNATTTGHPTNPLTDADIEAKFGALSAPLLPPSQIERACDAAWRMSEFDDIGKMTREFVAV